jgi:HEAT repeat protein
MMNRRYAVFGIALVAVLLFVVSTAMAGRLGGAYRGPYSDDVRQSPEETTTEVTSGEQTAPSQGEQPKSGEGEKGGTTTADDPPAEPPPGEGGEEPGGGSEEPGGAGVPDGGNTGDTTGEKPSAPGTGSPSSGGLGTVGNSGTGPKGKVQVDDVQAFWPFWFEHNKEWILAELLRKRGAQARIPGDSSPAFFAQTAGTRTTTPVTNTQKTDEIFPVLVEKATHSESDWVRDAAVLALGKLGTAECVPILIERMKTDPVEDIREDALLALGLTRQDTAFGELVAVLQGKNLNLKSFAALGLGLLGKGEARPLIIKEYEALIRSGKEDAAACLAVAMGMLDDGSFVDQLAQPLKTRGSREMKTLKIYICQALGRIGGDKAREWLTMAINGKDKAVQGAAILALSEYADKGSVRLLMKNGLKSGDQNVQDFALVSLARIAARLDPGDTTYRQIREELKKIVIRPAKNKYQAMYAAIGLGIMGDDVAKDYFSKNLSYEESSTDVNRSAVALASGLIEQKTVIGDLRQIVRKDGYDQDLRGYAAWALGIMGDLKSKDPIVDSMKRYKNRRDLIRSGCWAVGLLGGSDDVSHLIDVLKRDEASFHEVRGAAALAIGLINDGTAVTPLLGIVEDDTNTSNQAFAIVALGCLIDKEPVPRMPQIFANVHYRNQIDVMKEVMMNL